MSSYYSDKLYEGKETIVVAMDIGTTHSAVSFVYLSPGSRPQGKMVAHWPGQPHWNGAAKVPTLVSYENGLVKGYGLEAEKDFEEYPENVARWFKLHLHPAAMKIPNAEAETFETPPLPKKITIEQVYVDFMQYMMVNTHKFFEMTTPNGEEIWARLRDTATIVLATPNGWTFNEQEILRRAAIKASLVTGENARRLLRFVTEAEASVHYALANHSLAWLQHRAVFAVIDCGGSTVDTTVYRCTSINPLRLKETCPSECVQAGGIYVNRKITQMLKDKIYGTSFDDPEILRSMMRAFEAELKPSFDDTMEKYELKFGSLRDHDPTIGIQKGRITLSRQDLATIFDSVTNQILGSCLNTLINQKTKHAILVGGFAESPYVRKVLSRALRHNGIQVIMVGDYTRKAAAEGAIITYIKQFVSARAVKATYGGCVRQNYDKKLHHDRKQAAKIYPDGQMRVDDAFHTWVTKGTVLQETSAYKLPYHLAWDANTRQEDLIGSLGTTGIEVFAWDGDGTSTWCKDEGGKVIKGMRLICTLCADLSALAKGLRVVNGFRGKRHYRVDYIVCVYFGDTQLRATLQWKEGRTFRESEVNVISDVF
ncbi:hypothetical protein M408DRAFT_334111 [Serendipita vermifera MAFF 305830]|uniref:Uncharacterized protein n=1 Tax=Serendipita vermifera MAFF 305830 TaxID=933852 RepID=A0A0C3A691_SERVB|nr:hypothetical protein M408DRAFT_334111 [Serendipita vermifera MAFF 305830]